MPGQSARFGRMISGNTTKNWPAFLKRFLKAVFYTSVPFKSLFWIVLDTRARIGSYFGDAWYNSGSTHYHKSLSESIDYIESTYKNYLAYAGLDALRGRVAELGPGDSAGVAMLLRGSGASRVELIERYSNDRRPEQQSEIYRTLAERHGIQWLDQTGEWREDGLDGIEWSIGRCAEEVLNERVADGGQPFDYMLSSGVVEHFANPDKVFENSLRSLRPGGKLLHYIDLRDHDLFSQSLPELSFLRVPECVYRFMITATSGPNRIRLGEYLTMLERLRLSFGIRYQITVTSLVAVGELQPPRLLDEVEDADWERATAFVRKHRGGFSRCFRHMDERHLSVNGVFVVVEKPLETLA